MKKYVRRMFPALTCLLSCISAYSITVTEMTDRIASFNLNLRADSAAVKAAVLEASADNTLPPISIEYSPFFRPGVRGTASSELIVSQEFDFPTLYAARDRQAALDGEAARGEIGIASREIRMGIREACLDYLLLKEKDSILSERILNSRNLLATFERRLELREATLLDVNRIRLSLQDLEREKLNNEISMQEIRGRLETLSAGAPLPLDSLEYDATEIVRVSTEDYARNNPATIAAQAEVEAARQQLRLSKSGWLPSISIGYRRNTEVEEASNGFLVGASFPLFSISRKKKAAAARLAAATLRLDAAAIEAENTAKAAMSNADALRESVASFDLTLTRETIALYRKSLDARQITLTDFYTGTDDLYDRLLLHAKTLNDYHRALIPLRW